MKKSAKQTKPQTPRLYIAYGSNLNQFQMNYRCPTAKVVDTAVVTDYQLMFRGQDGFAVATIEPSDGAEVPVMVWNLQEADEKALDLYEGYPSFYRKEMMTVNVNGEPTEAMVYVMNDGEPFGNPSRKYLNTIIRGYEMAGFNKDTLFDALCYSFDRHKLESLQHLDDSDFGMKMW